MTLSPAMSQLEWSGSAVNACVASAMRAQWQLLQ